MNQKGLAPILLVLLIAAVAGIGGYLIYTNYSNNQTKITPSQTIQITTQPSTTPDPTANWETYTNTKYSFYLKYPPSLTPKENLTRDMYLFDVSFINDRESMSVFVDQGDVEGIIEKEAVASNSCHSFPSFSLAQNKGR